VSDLAGAEVAVRAVLLVPRRNVEVELQRVVPQVLDDALGLVGAGFGVSLRFGVAVAVDADLVAVLATEELVGGHLQDLAREVVQRDFDTRDGCDGDALHRALPGHLLNQMLVQAVDVERVLADDERLHPLDEFRDPGAPVRLAGADDAGVGVDPHERPREVPVDHRRLNVRDLDVTTATAFRRNTHGVRGQFSHRVLRVRVVQPGVVPRHSSHFNSNCSKSFEATVAQSRYTRASYGRSSCSRSGVGTSS
jgi:hypothetical protein